MAKLNKIGTSISNIKVKNVETTNDIKSPLNKSNEKGFKIP
jgi:hypothetical protein